MAPRYIDSKNYFIADTLQTAPVKELWQYQHQGKGAVTLTKSIYRAYPGHAPLSEMDVYVRPLPNHEEDVIILTHDPAMDTLAARCLHRINPEHLRRKAEHLMEHNTLPDGSYGLCGTETYNRLHEGHSQETDRPVDLEEAAALLKAWGWKN